MTGDNKETRKITHKYKKDSFLSGYFSRLKATVIVRGSATEKSKIPKVFLLAGSEKLSETIIPVKYSYRNFDRRFLFDLQGLIFSKFKGIYSGIPIFRTSKGNKNWLEKSESSRNREVKLQCLSEER